MLAGHDGLLNIW